MRIGRNDPCPCGSGKKFKRCCGASDEGVQRFRGVAPQGEPVSGWARVHAIWPKTRETLVDHGRRWLGAEGFAEALADFPFDTSALSETNDSPLWAELFLTWQLHDWTPGGEDVTVAEHWLGKPGPDVSTSDDVRRMIQSASDHVLSFYQVQAIDRGRGAVLKNLLADEELFVVDRSMSESVPPWTILFARLVEFGGITIFDAVGYQPLPPDMAEELVALSEDALDADAPMPISTLRKGASELVDIYDDILSELAERHHTRPVLHTTDGELLVLCESTFRIEEGKRDEVVERLGGLGFERDNEGTTTSFRWIRENTASDPLPTVHLGTVTVVGDALTIETRSRERHARLTEKVTQALQSLIQHVASKDRDQSEVFEELATQGEADGSVETPKSIPPELQQTLMREFLSRHYSTWPDIEIPALGGKTPREAVQSPSGRSQVESLLRDMEFRTHGSPMAGAYDFNVLRKELGLPAVG